MAISHNIKFARGTSTKRATTTSTLSAGQPFYETDTHRLYVGATDNTSLKDMSLQGCFFDAETVCMLIKASNLEKASWATIKSVSDMGLGGAVWAVGDTKSVALSGTVVGQAVPEVVSAVIIGFDHNSSVEGTGVTFQFGFIDDGEQAKHVAFVASNYDSYNERGSGFCMNTTDTHVGGWASSYMKTTICPAFKAVLPSDLQSVIKTVTKYTDNRGDGKNVTSNVTATSEDIFLLSEFEVRGKRLYANSYEQNYQKQYEYYANGGSSKKIKYRHDTLAACHWWLRSAKYDSPNHFCRVVTNGGSGQEWTDVSLGFSPAFVV